MQPGSYPAGCSPSPSGGIVCQPGVDPFANLHLGSGSVPGYDQGTTIASLQPLAPIGAPNVATPNAPTASYQSNSNPPQADTQPAPQTAPVSSGGTASISGLIALVTDLPRLATIFVGFILLIIGLAMLGARPAVQILTKAGAKGVIP